MTKTPLLWLFLLINILTASGSTSTTKVEDLGTFRQQKETKSRYVMMITKRSERANPGLHTVQHAEVSQKAKANGGTNNVKDHKVKNSASNYSIKSSSLIIPVTLLVGYFL
ncbi:hypothetical protein Fmac_026543 [Flemingia macrophylla]|uniref:Uncharacterized protein n=1 Tax=Flemingia macrophylla TaxID=520843 RepID=A0ABD1LF67_9FABA